MKYVMRALGTGKHSFGRKVLHFVTVVAAAMLFLNSPEWGGKCWFGMFLPVLVCCTLTSRKNNKPLFAVLFLLDLSFYSSFFNVLLKLGISQALLLVFSFSFQLALHFFVGQVIPVFRQYSRCFSFFFVFDYFLFVFSYVSFGVYGLRNVAISEVQ